MDSQEADANRLVAELVMIGETDGYYRPSDQTGKFDKDGKHVRARAIGEELHRMGGHKLMQAAYYHVERVLGPRAGVPLQSVWHRVGDWLA
jgi:hypothetical protein